MTNREKVLKGLECCASKYEDACQKCPYEYECNNPYESAYGFTHLAADALELLKQDDYKNRITLIKDKPIAIKCKECRW